MFKLIFGIIFYFTICYSTITIEAKIVKHVFEVKYISGAPDGVYKEKILGINGQFPGPLIEADLGDILQVDLINRIQDGQQNTSLHWHGIHQKGTPFEDGTSQITQCPLRNGDTQRYEIPLHQAGTYWYHSHVGSQYTEGMFGALIVHNKPETHAYDEEIVITLNDWYHQTAKENEEWPISNGVPPYPNSGMINGIGRYNCEVETFHKTACNPAEQKRSVFKVQKNKTYRIRVINTSAVAAFNFSIDGHKLETIEVDGTDVTSGFLVDIVPIAAAQRYSFLIRSNASTNRHLIRANMKTESLLLSSAVPNINLTPNALMPEATAVLEYVDNPQKNTLSKKPEISTEPHSYLDNVLPISITIDTVYLHQTDLSPFDGIPSPSYFDKEIVLEVDFSEDSEDIRRGSFNRTPFVLPEHKPLLMTFLDNEPIPDTAIPIYIEYMSVVQIVINNSFYGPHPFHMHGHSFWVLGTGALNDGPYDPSKHNLTLMGAKRDTVLVEELSWAVIRFVADNPGVWTFHCHIDFHNLSGMALTLIVAPEMARSRLTVTEEAKRVCGWSHHSNSKAAGFNTFNFNLHWITILLILYLVSTL